MDNLECPQLHLQTPQSNWVPSEAETEAIVQCLANPAFRNYLQNMVYRNIEDHANIPFTELDSPEKRELYALKAAYIKGQLYLLHRLLTIQVKK